jgi:TolB-like protein/Tfp pilus assembly protein PilF
VRSLAVLPLRSLDASDQYLGLGIADAVIRKTSQTGELIVRPTSAVRRYLEDDVDALTAARQLSADVVLEGSVQRAGDRLRVSVNLLRSADGQSIWADSFDMRLTDIFEIQDTVAQQVASHLHLQLEPSQRARLDRRYTGNPVAYEFYLRGLQNLDQRMSLTNAQQADTIGLFAKAIEADPKFALAHAQLAYAAAINVVFTSTTDDSLAARARREIERAEELDRDLPEIALARSQLLFSRFGGYDLAGAVRALKAAQRLNPNLGHADLGYLYYHLGLPDLAERALRRALDIDPTSEFAKQQTMGTFEHSGQWDRWQEAHQRLQPNEPLQPWHLLQLGRAHEAERALDRSEGLGNFGRFLILPARAVLAAVRGDAKSAEAAIPSLLSRHPVKDPFYHHTAYVIACIYAIDQNSAESVKWLREAVATGYAVYPLFERSILLDKIRTAPQFVQLMTELKATTDRHRIEFAPLER